MQNYIVALVLVFKGTSILFSIAAVPIYFSTNSVGGFLLLHSLSSIYIFLMMTRYEVIIYYSFDLYFSNN